MKRAANHTLNPQSGIFIIAALALLVIAAYFFLWVRPACDAIESLDRKTGELEFRIEKQKKLLPVYQELAKKKNIEIPAALALPEKKKLPKAEIDSIVVTFKDIAAKADMAMLAVKPDLSVLENNPGLVTVDSTIKGTFFNFREFLFELAKLSYLEKIDGIFIKEAGAEKEISMKLWVAVE
jgi:Tfp pilus assembly protein PilO